MADKPDEFGRFRVTDKDTKTEQSIFASQLPHGNYTVVKEPASFPSGEARPPEFKAVETTGQKATTQKEKD